MNTSRRTFKLFTSLLAMAALASIAGAQTTYIKANNTTALGSDGSWTTTGFPNNVSTDIARWDSTVTAANSTVLGADLSWLGIQIVNPGGAVTIGGSNTLTLGASGIDMTAATQTLTINTTVVLDAAQTWDVTSSKISVGDVNNGGNLLTTQGAGTINIMGNLSGSGGITSNGTGASAISIRGSSTYTGNTTINGGVISLGFGGTTGSIASTSLITGTGGIFQISRSDDIIVANTITGAIGLKKVGTGVATLTGVNDYTGVTTARSGTLLINGSITGATSVDAGALGGSGTVGSVTFSANGGELLPGGSVGTTGVLNTGNINLTSTGVVTVTLELNGLVAGTGYDQINTVGAVNLGTNEKLSLTLGFTPSVGDSFTIINNDGIDPITGAFDGLAEGTIFAVGGTNLQISYLGGTGNDVVLTTVVPEPFTWGMLVVGMGMIVGLRRIQACRKV